MSDLTKPADQFGLIGDSWPLESESAYHMAKVAADDAAACASAQSQSSSDAEDRMSDEHGKTAGAVSDGYRSSARQLREQSINYSTLSAWMADAEGKVRSAKTDIASLVRSGTSEIRDALDSETSGTTVTPSSNALTDKYRGDIASVATQLTTDLDDIGHALHGDPGSSRSPSYTSVSTTPTPGHPDPHMSAASYTGDHHAPAVEPHQLPPMPRVTSPSTTESTSGASTPTAPVMATHSVNPTLSNLVSGGGSPSAASPGGTSAPHAPSSSTPDGQSPQAHQSTEQHRQAPKTPGLPHIPSLPLDGLPIAAAESIATAVTSSAAHQLSTASSTITSSVPAPTGFTPGVAGTPPVTPVTPAPLTPIGGGGLSSPPVTQPAAPAPQATPPAAPQQTTTTPSPTRGPVADLGWIQRNYGLAPGIESPKPEAHVIPALFTTDLPESHLHRVLATLRQEFETNGWSQPLAVATLRRGFETRLVYVTADDISIHPRTVRLPAGVTPLDDMPGAPTHPEMAGSLMVIDKLAALIPCNWEIETVLSTVPSDEQHQTAEQYRELVEGGELLPCTVSCGREGVEAGEAMSVFARAALGSGGCSDLDAESSRLRAARWVGVQPSGYGEVLRRWYLSDAAECMSRGAWGEAVYCSEKYMSVQHPRSQAA